MGSGKQKAPAAPKYKSIDGKSFSDPNQAADRDRQLQLASALGFDRSSPGNQYQQGAAVTGQGWRNGILTAAAKKKGLKLEDTDPFDAWVKGLTGETRDSFNKYNGQGLTAADYRAEQRLAEQENQAKAAQEQRKASIAASRGAVDESFNTFDDNYYGGISKSVMDYYLPQIEEQFGEANKQLTYKFARQGNLKSTAANDEKAKLQGQYDLQRASVTNNAADAERAARDDVSATKSRLYNYAESAADPAAVNTQLSSETARVRSAVPQMTPMGKVFTDYLSPVISTVGAGLASEAAGYPGMRTGLFNNKNSSSYKVNG